jgi:hypothetical protein
MGNFGTRSSRKYRENAGKLPGNPRGAPSMDAFGQFTFDGFRFDSRTGQLWRDGREIKLTPRTTAVLRALAAHAQDRWHGLETDSCRAVCRRRDAPQLHHCHRSRCPFLLAGCRNRACRLLPASISRPLSYAPTSVICVLWLARIKEPRPAAWPGEVYRLTEQAPSMAACSFARCRRRSSNPYRCRQRSRTASGNQQQSARRKLRC